MYRLTTRCSFSHIWVSAFNHDGGVNSSDTHYVGVCDTEESINAHKGTCILWSDSDTWAALDQLSESNGQKSNLEAAAKSIWPSVQGLLGLAGALCCCTLLYSVVASFIPCNSSHPIKYANAVVMLLVAVGCLISWSVAMSSDTMNVKVYEAILHCSVGRTLGSGYWCCICATVLAVARAIAFLRAN